MPIGEKTLRSLPPQIAQVDSDAADIDCTTSMCSPHSVQAYSYVGIGLPGKAVEQDRGRRLLPLDDSNALGRPALPAGPAEAVGHRGGQAHVRLPGGRRQLVEDDLGAGLQVAVERDPDHRPAAPREVVFELVDVDQPPAAD